MHHKVISSAACLVSMLAVGQSFACDHTTGKRQQAVYLQWNNQNVTDWVVESDNIKSIALPNGFKLGVKIDSNVPKMPASSSEIFKFVPELVHITLFDMSGASPKRLTETSGGANSIQGYGAQGGADRVAQLGSPGIRLTLLKPVCAASAAR